MIVDKDQNVIARLRRPVKPRKSTIKSLVRRHIPDVLVARQNGKTWSQIGEDLRPDDPVKGDTVRKSVARIGKLSTKTRPRRQKTASPELLAEKPQMDAQPVQANPFGRRVDPIRGN